MTAPTTESAPPARIAAPLQRIRRARGVALLGMVLLLVLCRALSIAVGARDVSTGDIWDGLLGRTDDIAQAAVAKRVPRTALAAIAGAALAVSGLILQGFTRNPLADPHILGLSTGATLAIVTGIAWFGLASATSYIWVAIAGAGVTALFVWCIGSLGRGGATPLKLTLAGAATTAALTSEPHWVGWSLHRLETRMYSCRRTPPRGSRPRVATAPTRRPLRCGWSGLCAQS